MRGLVRRTRLAVPSPTTENARELAIHNLNFTLPGGPEAIAPALLATARAAEEGGATQFTVMDHYFQMDWLAPAEDPMLEGYTTLGYLAGVTDSMQLGLLVTGVTYRHPGLLAKIVSTLDVLSGGRAMLGIGAAWYQREHDGLGVPYPPVSERFERLEETLQICLQMWSDDDGAYDGRHYQLAETICRPQSVQRPRPPILIGGGGEKKTLRLVAQYADACNLIALAGVDEIARKLEILDRHCADVGRDPAEIERTINVGGDALNDPDGFLRNMERYAALGVRRVGFSPMGPDPAAEVSTVCETVLPRLREL